MMSFLQAKRDSDASAAYDASSSSEVWTGKDVFVEGVWCIKDIGTSEYETLTEEALLITPREHNAIYATYVIYFIVVIIALFMIKRIAFLMTDTSNKKCNDRSNKAKKALYKLSAIARSVLYRRFPRIVCEVFQLPSSFGNFIIIMSGVLYILCYCFIPKPYYMPCAGMGSPPLALRSGIQATALVPIIIMLSGKSNIISQLTGISYEKLNVYHRWTSVICCLLGWVHAVAFYYQATYEGGTPRLSYSMDTDSQWGSGIPPLVFLTVLTIFSHPYVRAVWYELWLNAHWVCAIGFYISLFSHTGSILGSSKYLAAAIVFWVSQMLWRGLSKNFLRPNRGFMRSNPCTMRRLASSGNSHYFEINVSNTNDFTWSSGQHVFLRIPGLRFLEAHPFSIVSYCEPMEKNSMKFIVKTGGWKGMTSLIYDKLPEQGYKETTVFVDGPYGGTEREIDSFNNLYLISSGTGITAIIPFLMEFIDKSQAKKSILESVRLDWIVRDCEDIEWIKPELKRALTTAGHLISEGSIQINIYAISNMEVANTEAINELLDAAFKLMNDEKAHTNEEPITNFINIWNNKPNIREIIERDIVCTLNLKNMFVVSGSDSIRVAASNSVANLQRVVLNSPNVDEIYMHSETFGW